MPIMPIMGIAAVVGSVAVNGAALAVPDIVETDWSLIRTIPMNNPIAAHFNPVDGLIYVGRRGTGGVTDGLYVVDHSGTVTQVVAGENTAAVFVEAATGDVFIAEDFDGIIFRVPLGATVRETWVTGFHSGDDDPVGMATAPADYTGPLLVPGEAVVVDRGNSGLDEIWRWSTAVPEGETVLHADNGTLGDATDVAISQSTIFIIDRAAPGRIWTVNKDATLTQLVTSSPLSNPGGLTIDPLTGDLLIVDGTDERVVRVNPVDGTLTDVITGIGDGVGYASIDITADGQLLVVTSMDDDLIHVFSRCEVPDKSELDCNGNDVLDACDIAFGTSIDCNGNGIPDDCDIANGTSSDCNDDGIPDECPNCVPVELVFVMDTSSSMNDEAASLCSDINFVISQLNSVGLVVQPRLLGICTLPGGSFACLEDRVDLLLGVDVPGNPPAEIDTLGDCPGGNEVCSEDWALATAIVAGLYPWEPEGASVRLIVPISDEGPWCGNPISETDLAALNHAAAVAVDAGVIISPIAGSGSSAELIALTEQLAAATGGQAFVSSKASVDIANAIIEGVLAACATVSDCNQNGTPDDCDIASGTSADLNNNGIPDECEDCPGDLNRDGVVNPADLAILLAAWGPSPPPNPADINGDGVVGPADLAALLAAWGPCFGK
ncbi:MAG: hypothetical protein KDA22_00705 [Phycisphaerales bacterium]|nr:hypothetical protein [Phycisphaerales bacterium]